MLLFASNVLWKTTNAGESWETLLGADLVSGSDLRIRLWLTKWLDPSVEVGYEVVVL